MSTIASLIKKEEERQRSTLMLIPSENYTYKEIREAVGSVLMHKYSEGYSGKRYYQGNSVIDEIELMAIENAKKLFGVPHANVQALSGSPANSAVYMGLLSPGDTIMGMSLASGGHLTHGHPKITFSGKFFRSVQYEIEEDGSIDFKKLREAILKENPKILVVGTTAYPKVLDFEKFAKAVEGTQTLILADISHFVGLVIAGLHPDPAPFVDVITSTTHKMLRGPRGAVILVTEKGLSHDPDMAKKIDRGVFPGLQGGPHNNVTAGIAIALEKAAKPEYREYASRIVKNAKALANALTNLGFDLVTGGTENHLVLIDMRQQNISGKDAAIALEKAGIVVNANAIPFDPSPPMNPSGIRLGTPAVTARGMGNKEMELVTSLINKAIENFEDEKKLKEISEEVKLLCEKFPTDF